MSQLLNNWMPVAAVVAVLLAVIIAGVLIRRRNQARNLEKQFSVLSVDMLSDVILPDGDGGEIHMEYVLLTGKGILVLDTRDVEGNIFGSDTMADWTVLGKDRRFTFSNPQYPLFDRLAAIKRLVRDVPVTGYVAFTNRGQFSKGEPSNVIHMNALLEELRNASPSAVQGAVGSWEPEWDLLKEAVITARFSQLMKQ